MKIDYGKKGLELFLKPSWNTTILKPKKQKSFADPVKKIRDIILKPLGSEPLKKIIEQKNNLKRVCIVVSDSTRPVPSHLILDALVKELNEYGIQDQKILILIATGLHRVSRDDELERILGRNLKNRLKVISHIATDKDLNKDCGYTSDNKPIYINKEYCRSDVKIITGYVEPHFFFGFSGGRKAILPGIAGAETIQANHSAKNIASPFSRFGIYKKNIMHQNATEVAKLVGVDFAINTCINEKHEMVKVEAGDFELVHEKLVNFQLKNLFKKVKKPYDVVICGNGGYPLDLNLYQAVKSMAIGEMVVKKGGTIISVNECSEGVGIGQEKFKDLLFSGVNPKILYDRILKKEIVLPEQWEIQILTRILMKANVILVSSLKANEIGNIGLKYADTIKKAIKMALVKENSNARILILPNGPQILPILK